MNALPPSAIASRWLDFKSGILLVDLVLFAAMLLWLPFEPMVNKGLAILIFTAVLWLTEALHISVTALLIPVLATLLGVFDMRGALVEFANPILFLFLGGFALAAALSRQGLDVLLAGKVLQLAGGHLGRSVLLLFLITAGLSMWISNTATTAMMLPLALGMLARLDLVHDRPTFVFVLLGIAYSASIGGIGTLVGSPPNAIAAAQLGIGFTQWMLFGLPIMLLLLPCAIGLLYLLLRPQLRQHIPQVAVRMEWTGERRLTLGIFLITVLLWIASQPLSALLGIAQLDTLIAMAAIIAIVVCRVASWADISNGADWGVLILFGGGLTLSGVLKVTGTSAFLAGHLSTLLAGTHPLVMLLLLTAFVVFLTELVSNTAAAALLIPLFVGVAEALGLSPLVIAVLIAVCASCAFMLPVATPPNALVFATGQVQQREMMKAGFWLNLLCTLLLGGLAWLVLA
jgi:sodium-dependent dicarboxylate transporter 2/3/5